MAFAARGARVVIADVDLAAAERVVGAIRQADGVAAPVRADVADPASVEAYDEQSMTWTMVHPTCIGLHDHICDLFPTFLPIRRPAR